LPPLQSSSQSSFGNDDIDLAEIGRTLARRWRRITTIVVIVTGIAIYSVLFASPQFQVTGSVYLGATQTSSETSQAAAALDFLSDFQVASDVETQIELIQARALLEQVILETGLNATARPVAAQDLLYWRWHFHFEDAVDAFAPEPGQLKVLDATFADPGEGGATYGLVFGQGGRYQVVTTSGWMAAPRPLLTGALNQQAAGPGLAFMIVPALPGDVPAPGSRYILSITPAEAVASRLLHGPLVVEAGGTSGTPTQIANIAFNCANPYVGRDFVNQLMRDFIATQLSWKTGSASATETFVAGQLQKIRASLALADQSLAAYQSKTGIVDVPANAQAVITTLSQYHVQETTLQLQLEALQELASSLSAPGDAGLNPYLVSQTGDPLLNQLAGNLATAEVQLQALRVQFTPAAQQVQVAAATVANLEGAIRSVVTNDEAQASRGLANIDHLIAGYEAELRAMPAEALQVIALTRSSDVFGQLYVLLMQKEEEAEVSKAATIVDTRIVSPAEIPLSATKPKAGQTVAAGIFLGLCAGIGLVLAARAMSGRFHSDDDIRRAVPLPVYALIPARPRGEANASVFATQTKSPFIEAFRLLRSNIYQSASANRQKVILVTSPSNADGKTTISSNLAKVLADDGQRVVLVDADLHRGRVHEVLKINQAPGLTEWLIGSAPAPLQTVPEQRFQALTAGVFPPNPSELLNESSLGTIFEGLRQNFDYVIVDCPPLPAVADTMSLGRHADLIMSLIYVDKTRKRSVAVHNETLSTLDRRHGMIINGVVGSAYGYGYGYGYIYEYIYSYGPDESPSMRRRLRRLISWLLRG